MSKLKRLTPLFFFALTTSAFTPTHKTIPFEGPIPALENIDRRHYPDADLVVISDSGKLTFAPGSQELVVRETMRILTPGGRSYARVTVYLDHFTELVSVSGRSYAPDEANDPKKHALLAEGSVGYFSTADDAGLLYAEMRKAVFDIPSADVGDVIEYEMVTRSRQLFSADNWLFDHQEPVIDSKFEVVAPATWEIRSGYYVNGVPAKAPLESVEQRGNDRVSIFRRRNLAPVEGEALGRDPVELRARLRVGVAAAPGLGPKDGVFADWRDLVLWYEQLSQGSSAAPEAALALDAALRAKPAQTGTQNHTETQTQTEERQIFDFVRDSIRYVGFHRGIGSFRPRDAAETYRTRYGDCKDMANLLVALYRHRKIEAYPVLISTRGTGPLDDSVPSAGQFNHLIVALRKSDGTHQFLDPTAKFSEFGELSWPLHGRRAVVLSNPPQIVDMPSAAEDANLWETNWTVGQGGKINLRARLRGATAQAWRSVQDQYLKDWVSGSMVPRSELEVVTASVSMHPENNEVHIFAELRERSRSELPGGLRLLPLGNFFFGSGEIRVPEGRRSPVVLDAPRTIVEKLVVEGLGDETVEKLPAAQSLRTAAIDLDLKAEREGGAVIIVRTTRFKQSISPPERLLDVRKFAELMNAVARDAILFRRASVADSMNGAAK